MNVKQILNTVTLLGTLAVNTLANVLPFNGRTTGEVSNAVPTLFTPAAYVFTIWSVIYLWLFAFIVYQALPGQRNKSFIERIGPWFALSCIFNSVWIFLWHYEQFLLTVPIMLGLLLSLIVIYERLGVGRRQVPAGEKYLVHAPFSIYLGWISVATIANFAVTLRALGWSGFGLEPEVWTAWLLIVGAILGVVMTLSRNEVLYPLVIVWAFVGIVIRQQGNVSIVTVAGSAALVVFLVLITKRLAASRA